MATNSRAGRRAHRHSGSHWCTRAELIRYLNAGVDICADWGTDNGGASPGQVAQPALYSSDHGQWQAQGYFIWSGTRSCSDVSWSICCHGGIVPCCADN